MITITSSQIVSAVVQSDGRTAVSELHVASDGRELTVDYLADVGLDINAVLSARAANIQSDLQAREAIEAQAMNYEIPLTQNEFMDRFTAAERIAIRAAAKTDANVEDLLDYLAKSKGLYRASAKVQSGLDYLISQNLLASTRKAEILA